MKAWEHLSCEYIEIEIESLQIYIQLTSFLFEPFTDFNNSCTIS